MRHYLFDFGPLPALQSRLGLNRDGADHSRRNACAVLLLTWGPLMVLNAIQQWLQHDAFVRIFARDFGVIARFVVAAPLLVAAESWALPRLTKVTDRFLDSTLLESEEDRIQLRQQVTTTKTLSSSALPEIVIIIAAYALTAVLHQDWFLDDVPHWYGRRVGDHFESTLAGQWQAFVSLPVLFILILSWIWRQILWCRILRVISRLNLLLIAAHPDGAGGLTFMHGAVRGYWPVGFAFGAIVAGAVRNQLHAGTSLYDARYVMIGLLVFVIVIFVSPFAVFTPNLLRLKEAFIFEYGELGHSLGEQFENKQVKKRREVTAEALEIQDFSAMTDLYSIVANTYRVSYFPVTFGAIRELSIVTMLPFIPVVLSVIPFDQVLQALGKLLT